ncbi:unnamed protein product [Rotaria magnacalcarata]|uniref:Uncharacterized protein n=1 Tax=Rotaria magnacalcarata TaxID=392030 RepID=A0A816LT99_9BILA|nr:unnamed protein product [Rotaria magnacalcarata]CAF1945739.1 unnamed protein product [Rotaria magnacalcarata]CAF2122970.1 unnamed protein product [Rotaria magnacalcarata]CAF3834427.1 unnamed protein product [Rotaria magnacalcarata]CAF3891253.1 unnamed protein product [Rotaria magnacalcarata]
MASENNSIRDNRAHSTDSKGSQLQENVRRPSNSSSADRDNVKPQSRPQSMIKVVETVQINPDYMTISGHLRSSICFGYPVARSSHAKLVHNAQIFKEHFEMVASEQRRHPHSFRRKKDWLGRWTEANITRQRLVKELLEAQKKTTTPSA